MSEALSLQEKKDVPWHRMLVTLLLALFVFLAVRAHDEYYWSHWGFGDAQTMLSLKQWDKGGWIDNYLLFKPQGYAPVVDLLDTPALRQHAHGTSYSSSPRVGPRLWYTHYPAGYLIPYAILYELGGTSLFPQRLLSITISLGALVLMYLLFARLTRPGVSLLAVFFYATSAMFLGYADCLANQPLDDLLRFAFMLMVVLATSATASPRQRRFWFLAAWLVEFLLSLSSFDSVFFLYLWLIGWDLLERRGFRWRTYLLFALAPIFAHCLQFLQNAWYLGWTDAGLDIVDTFLIRGSTRIDTGDNLFAGRLGVVVTSLVQVFYMAYSPGLAVLVVFALYLFYRFRLAAAVGDQTLPSGRLLLLLALCGIAYVLILPQAARMSYEGRQLIPFTALLVSGCTWSVLDGARFYRAQREPAFATQSKLTPVALPAYLMLAGVVITLIWLNCTISNRYPSPWAVGQDNIGDILFAGDLKEFATPYEPVYFDVGGFKSYLNPAYSEGYPQILPDTEYYTGSRLILCFDTPEWLAKDMATLIRKATAPFSPMVVAGSQEQMEQTLVALNQQGVLTSIPENNEIRRGRYLLDLTPFVKW